MSALVPLVRSGVPWPRHLRSGALEAAKWLALLAMLVDHVHAVFFGRSLGVLADATGRLALPLFALVLAYNMARPGADLHRLLVRLLLFGLLSVPWYAPLFGGAELWWFPANILFTFAVAVMVVQALERGHWAVAVACFLAGGLLVEYGWIGVALVVSACAFFAHGGAARAALLAVSFAALCWWNGNAWALLSIPVLLGLHWSALEVPRVRWAFWVAYPAHLAAIWMITALGL